MTVTTVDRPYLMTLPQRGYGISFPLSSTEAQEMLDHNPVITATRERVVLHDVNNARWIELTPATLGGGAAFVLTR